MNKDDARVALTETLLPAYAKELANLDRIDKWVNNTQGFAHNRSSQREKRYLEKLSRTPWLRLIVTSAAQMLYVERVYSSERDVQEMWGPWNKNRMDKLQVPLHTAAIQYGSAYLMVLPGDRGARMTVHSPREMMALYQDPVNDEWPMLAVEVKNQPGGAQHISVIDEEKRWTFTRENVDAKMQFVTEEVHGVGVCPVVRFCPRIDLDDHAEGEVKPYISTAARLIETDNNRLQVQRYNSWRIRTAEGLDDDASDEDLERTKQKLEHEDILTGTGETKFGTLDATEMNGFIAAHDSDLEALAAVSQTRTTALTGKMVNVSADAIVEANRSAYSKRDEFQLSFGGSHVQGLRLASFIEGRVEDAKDYSIRCGWADTDSLTMSASVDALGKASQMLGVPAMKLWPLIPGIDQTTAEEWASYAESHPSDDDAAAVAYARQVMSDGSDA